ncbi:MAG: hypothetical protein EBT07_13400 [Actinobacteria bacterium]|nr:hypothetical protein [Actinomycetota bacterium]
MAYGAKYVSAQPRIAQYMLLLANIVIAKFLTIRKLIIQTIAVAILYALKNDVVIVFYAFKGIPLALHYGYIAARFTAYAG